MIKKNSYKLKKKKIILICTLIIFGLYWTINSIDFKKIIKTEIEGFQQHFTSFSSLIQLFDYGNTEQSKFIKYKDIPPGINQFLSVLIDGIIKYRNNDFDEIRLFIKFKHLNKIYSDIEKANKIGLNYKPKNVPCKISDGIKILKCKVRLKGDLNDHWDTRIRFSMRIRVLDGFIHGLKNFSIQKPRARTFPYDQTFAKIHSDLGGLSSNDQRFYNIKVNSSYWGIMNIEPTIDDHFIEARSIKRSGVFRFSNQDNWIYKIKDNILMENHFISDPTVFFSQRGKETEILKDLNSREIYSHIFHSINSKKSEIFNRNKMIEGFVNALVWGRLHPLYNANSFYTWNAYTQKLEPILTDQGIWLDVEQEIKNIKELPFEHRLVFKNKPITEEEFLLSLNKINSYFKSNDPLIIANNFRNKYFPNDMELRISKIKNNIKFLKKNHKKVISWINLNSKELNEIKNNLDYNFPGEFSLNKDFVKIIHFTDGKVQIFNLLSKPIFISEIISGSKIIKVNKIIPGSKKNFLNKIEIKTNFIGLYDKKIKVISTYKNIEKKNYNNYSIIDKSSIRKINFSPEKICNFKVENNVCHISGEHNILHDLNFTKKVFVHPDTKINLGKNVNLIFNSNIEMDGSKNKPILISGPGSITILNTDKKNITTKINFVNFNGLSAPTKPLMRFTGSINGYGGKFIITNSIINDGDAEDQLNIVNADIILSKIYFNNSKSDAFDCDFCNGKIINVSFNQVGGDGLDLSGSKLSLSNIKVKNTYDKAVSIGESSKVNIKKLFVESSGTGIAVKDGSEASVNEVYMNDIYHDAFMTYIKKPFFKKITHLYVKNLIEKNNVAGSLCVREKNTFAEIDNKICDEQYLDVEMLYKKGRMKK